MIKTQCLKCKGVADADRVGSVVCRDCGHYYYDMAFDQHYFQQSVQKLVQDTSIDWNLFKKWCDDVHMPANAEMLHFYKTQVLV